MSSQVRILFPPRDCPNAKFFFLVLQGFKKSGAPVTSGSSSVGRAAAFQAAGRGFEPRLPLFHFLREIKGQKRRSSGVEYFLGKEGVTGSIPVVGSITENYYLNITLNLN